MAIAVRVRFLATAALCAAATGAALAGPGEQQITVPDGAVGDRFGEAIDGDGATVVIGAGAHDQDATDSGTAHVLVRCRGFLLPQAELRPSDPAAGGRFGRAVAVHGDVIAVGAPDAPGGGAVYVFVRTRGVWSQSAKLAPTSAAAGDLFGSAVDMDGDRIVAGAPGRDGGTGTVFLFVRDGTGWTESGAFRPEAAAADGTAELFGSAVAISGELVAATAPGAGTAHVGSLAGALWTEEETLVAPVATGVPLATSVALEDGTLAFGAAGDDSTFTNAGSVSVSSRVDGVWSPAVKLYAPLPLGGAGFGGAVALRGGALLAGAPGESLGGAGAGATYVFAKRTSGWTLQRRVAAPDFATGDAFGAAVALTPDGALAGAPGRAAGLVLALDALPDQKVLHSAGAASDAFGRSVAIDADTALVGAPLDDAPGADSGSVHVFVRTGFVWTLQTTLTGEDTVAGDSFGVAVALSGDTALMGASLHDVSGAEGGAAYVFVRTGTTWSQQAKLAPADVEAGDLLGGAVALAGDTALVAAAGDDDKGSGCGAVHVFVRSGTSWTRETKLIAGDGEVDDAFGSSLALSGDTAVVGAVGDDDRGGGTGSAYVFVRTGTTWAQQSKLLAPDGAAGDAFGTSVAVSGDIALVGAHTDDDGAFTDSGAVHDFVRRSGNWAWRSKLRASDAATNDFFGFHVAMSGDAAVVGAYGENRTLLTDAGAAYAFVRSATGWAERAKLTAADAAGSDFFGRAVALSGRTVLVGAHQDDDGGSNAGSAWIRALDLPSWNARAKVTASDELAGDQFGHAVALFRDTALVGSRLDDLPAGLGAAGSAYVFVPSGSAWKQEAALRAPEPNDEEFLGSAVAVGSDTALVGAPGGRVDDELRGTVHVFVRSGTVWTPEAVLAADDGAQTDLFGSAVALSGETALAGSPEDDDRGANSGSAYVFVRAAGAWQQQAKLLPEDLSVDYEFGLAVAIDGDTAVVGAPYDDDRGARSGSAYVFVRSGTQWTQQTKFTAADGAANGAFGSSVSISGDTVVVGAIQFGGAGAAYVFVRSDGAWTQQARLTASDASPGAEFGRSVSLSDGTLLVGAQGSGGAYVFVRSLNGWTETAILAEPAGGVYTGFAGSVALDGAAALVGAPADNQLGALAGAAHFFDAVPDPMPLAAGGVIPAEWTVGVPLDVPLSSSGGDAPRQWRVASGALPAGASVDSPGARIVGPPSESGDFAFTIECADACARTATFDGTLRVNAVPAIVESTLPPAAAGRPYTTTLGRTGGTGAFAWSLVGDGGSGLLLDAGTGALTGTPGTNGTFTLTVRGADALGAFAPDEAFDVVVGDRVDAALKGSFQEKIPQAPEPVFRTFDALAGSTLDVQAKAPKKSLPPTFVLLDPSGAPVDLGTALKVSKNRVQIRKLPLATTGRYALVIQPDPAGLPGEIAVSVVLRPGLKTVRPVALADGSTTSLAIAALPGSQVKCKIVAAKGQTVAPRVVSLTDAAGAPVVLGPVVETTKKSQFSFTASVGGDSTLVLGTRDGTSGGAVVTVTVRPPKGYGFTVPDPP